MPNQVARITVVENIYHRNPGQNPTQINSGFDRVLSDHEQVFTRTPPTPLNDQWVPLQWGWYDSANVGMVYVINTSTDSVIELGLPDVPWATLLLLPGEGQRITPANPAAWHMRCPNGNATYSISILPK